MAVYTISYRKHFAVSYASWNLTQRKVVRDFLTVFRETGLTYANRLPGKIVDSSETLAESDPKYQYAKDNWLWHYHVGFPTYETSNHGYLTSKFVLHFQWPNLREHIELVDLCAHNDKTGQFQMPPEEFLAPALITASPAELEEQAAASASAQSNA